MALVMNIKVVYHSKTGNTKRVAEAIAEALEATAIPVAEAESLLTEKIDLLFIGDGMYFGGIAKETKDFIKKLDASKIGCSAAFSTSGGSWPFGPTGITARLEEQGVSTHSETFRCHGAAFGAVFPSHPDDEDLKNAREFAERTIASVNQA